MRSGALSGEYNGIFHDLVARSVARVRRPALGFHPRDRQPRPAALTIGVLSLGELTRREAGRLQSSVSDQQVDRKHDQQNTADADAAAISPTGIAETAAKEEDQYKNNQDQVHPFLG